MAEHKYEGVLVVNKEQGPTSHDVVSSLRSITGMRRIGHCGTLDPLASGVLVVCLGRFTRLNEWLSAGEKEYETTFCLGATSDTYDAQGRITPSPDIEVPDSASVLKHLENFKGAIEQIPPAYSALKVEGVRSYKLARRNQAVPLKARRVHIAEIEVLHYKFPLLKLRVACARGTYIRSLAADLGAQLGCGGYVQALCRIRVGNLDLNEALILEQIRDAVSEGQLGQHFVPPSKALSGLSEIVLEPQRLERFAHGNPVVFEEEEDQRENQVCAVYNMDMKLCGIGRLEAEDGRLRPLKVLAPIL